MTETAAERASSERESAARARADDAEQQQQGRDYGPSSRKCDVCGKTEQVDAPHEHDDERFGTRAEQMGGKLLDLLATFGDWSFRYAIERPDPEHSPIGRLVRTVASAHRGEFPLEPFEPVSDTPDSLVGIMHALFTIDTVLHDLEHAANMIDEIVSSIPSNRDEIVVVLATAQRAYESTAGGVQASAIAYANEALMGARIKADCASELRAGGMSKSAAEKEASVHPSYVEHREKLVALQQEKADREADRSVAYARLETMRQLCSVVAMQIEYDQRAPLVLTPSTIVLDTRTREPRERLTLDEVKAINAAAAYFDGVLSIASMVERRELARTLFAIAGNPVPDDARHPHDVARDLAALDAHTPAGDHSNAN